MLAVPKSESHDLCGEVTDNFLWLGGCIESFQ
jgi:hypothetical protein